MYMKEMRNIHKMLIRKPKNKIILRRPTRKWEDVIILKWNLENEAERTRTESSGLMEEPVAGSLERDNKLLGSKKGGNFLAI
jgi:hypothetical protein